MNTHQPSDKKNSMFIGVESFSNPAIGKTIDLMDEMRRAVEREYPLLQVDQATRQLVDLMRATYASLVAPHFEEIKQQIALGGSTNSQSKSTFGFREVYSKSDMALSNALIDFARNRLSLPASYSEEHGPYSDGPNKIISYEDSLKHSVFLQFDPLDGSRRFMDGKAGFSIHAALLVRCFDNDYRPLVGIVYDPLRDEAWFNRVDGTLIFDKASQEQVMKPFEPIIDRSVLNVHCSKSGYGPLVEKFCGDLARISDFGEYQIVDMGSGGAHFSSFLRGEIHMAILPADFSKQWDNANAVCLIPLRGGQLMDFEGSPFSNLHRPPPYHFNSEGHIAFRGVSRESVLASIPPGIVQRG